MTRAAAPKLFAGRRRVFGAWTSLGHPSITEMFATAGVDFVGIDLEHSTISQEQAQRIMAAAQAAGVACLPRVAEMNGSHIRRLLDSGADGLIVPNVTHPDQVADLITWCKYPPLGKRSFGVARAQGYGRQFDAYVAGWNARSSLIIQIEAMDGVERIDALLAPEAIDGVMVGPYDLSGTLGVPGQLDHPRVRRACAKVIDACRQAGKACGTQLVAPDRAQVEAAFAAGYTFVVLASDVFILSRWSEQTQALVRAVRAPAARRHPVTATR